MRFDEDYSNFSDSTPHLYRKIKYHRLSKDGNTYASFGGSARLEYVDFNNEDWGRLGIGHNGFLLQRYDLHADLHLQNSFRFFTQIRSAWESGRKNGPRPIDEDHLNIQQLFFDTKVINRNDQTLTIRAGRQELDYGSGRLISVREGPNLRLYFDGAKLMYTTPKWSIDGFVMMADTINTGVFDNKSSKEVNLWGVYSKTIFPAFPNVDLYYIGIKRNLSVFEEGPGRELRHTIGTRIWRYGGGFIYNFEGAYQFGSFGNGRISAWTASVEAGYLFEDVSGKPSINLRNDYISGDRHKGDGNLQSFNPIYPKGGYFGFSPQIGPVNLIDLHPYATINIGRKMLAQADIVLNWRYSLQDGIYRPGGGFNLPGATSRERHIGTAYLASIVYSMNTYMSLNCGLQYFKTGAFIRDMTASPKDGLFINTRLSFKF
ncbi:alginate export family protein [Chitinophaga qingshengii]|uniref:Alginate export family protein n=1 Tax=Chitinophaga qingshengii TaxID=1569794 RepID=A0ABR7TP57_9BACT|nr:alginate export family protein [Chitinophaga qingshengii]MBC9932254.1 alginate export family protein [Chitinophaga qingshengii]